MLIFPGSWLILVLFAFVFVTDTLLVLIAGPIAVLEVSADDDHSDDFLPDRGTPLAQKCPTSGSHSHLGKLMRLRIRATTTTTTTTEPVDGAMAWCGHARPAEARCGSLRTQDVSRRSEEVRLLRVQGKGPNEIEDVSWLLNWLCVCLASWS